ncbi:S-adenosyl-L-methionine-dependent methyltransferase [Artemisia annua]|uniref:S-adenosyl-L-methionine-dependent methyltransferase n=1 Tax=Artemisia annua TaxID=35608 RepID=A0A2U1MYJ4_ARTAN|nr:S-adenosyl-L-methionine-dependent methyltransferase [Artemisia annua]
MASTSSSSLNNLLHIHHRTLSIPKFPSILKQTQLRSSIKYQSLKVKAASDLLETVKEAITPPQDTEVDLFACPVCFEPLIRKGPAGFNLPAIYRSGFKCTKCNKSYSSKNIYLDLTVIAGAKEYVESQPSRTELFRSPLVSFLYERGWRQNFNLRGFPGPDEEFDMAQEYFKPAEGGTLVDVSCGSGLFSRKFAKSGIYSKVVALDFSENMLRQTYDFIKVDDTILSSNLALVRADVSRLPFASGSIDAVHAGAALHCWPSPSNAIAEINRILRSGGVFVGTTFLRSTSTTPAILRPFDRRIAGNYNYLTEEEIEDLVKSCGFTNYTCKVQQAFIMFSAQKP